MPDDANERIIRILELDLEYLQRTVDKFDNQRFTIRSWSVTTSGALLALAVTAKNGVIAAVGLFVILFFSYLEIVYMDMQVRVMNRCTEIGRLLQSSTFDSSSSLSPDYVFGVRSAFGKEPFSLKRMRRIVASRPEIYMFYAGLTGIMSAAVVLILVFRG
ncbi:hypothetical protein ACWED2_07915 [Amycolatopsis sp. NPDC005003]